MYVTPISLTATDEIIIAWFGRVQGAALVAVRYIIYDGVLRTAPNPAWPHPAAVGIQPLFVFDVVWRQFSEK